MLRSGRNPAKNRFARAVWRFLEPLDGPGAFCLSMMLFGKPEPAFPILAGAGGLGLALASHGVFGRPAHQRGVILAEQHYAEADRGLDLHLAVGARLAVAAAQRLHQALGRLLDILLQVGIGPQRTSLIASSLA